MWKVAKCLTTKLKAKCAINVGLGKIKTQTPQSLFSGSINMSQDVEFVEDGDCSSYRDIKSAPYGDNVTISKVERVATYR